MRIDDILLEYGGHCSQQVEATDDDKQFHKAKHQILELIREARIDELNKIGGLILLNHEERLTKLKKEDK